ncbi:uncharacterized protein LOC119724563 [Patiria miniata]|uniref:Uncharacterized protein n=1 Tax=Patiria miniata TaxID=46514 RepID=A0A913ZIH9_PATMI|nr:uncharacterized protein LOC119724563 [Patiria miniata]
MKAVFFAVVLAVFLTRASALDCYSCNDCGLSGVFSIFESKTTCPNSVLGFLTEPRCVKEVASDGTVKRYCGTATTCGAAQLLVRCDSATETNCIICCSTDTCNNALTVKGTWLAVALALAAAFFAARS